MNASKYTLLTSIFIVTCCGSIHGQETRTLPSVMVNTLNQTNFSFSDLENNGRPILVHFWATWCTHCHNQLDNIADVYEDWQDETGVKVVAVSMDDSRSIMKVAPFVAGKGWEYEILLDPNGELKRALNVNSFPHTIIVNGNGEIVWTATSYTPGDEDDMFKIIKEL